MRRILQLVFFLCLGMSFPSSLAATDQEPAPLDGAQIPCTSCAGQGQVDRDCELCEGDGKGPCQECSRLGWLAVQPMQLAIRLRLDPTLTKEIEAAKSELRETLDKLTAKVGSASPGSVPGPGRVNCPAPGCSDGRSFLNRGFDCKPCKAKGVLKCGRCRGKGETTCAACLGKRQRRSTCWECRGTGKGYDPLARTTAALDECPWCRGADLVDCPPCQGEGLQEQHCVRCAGGGRVACNKCAGTERMACNKCSATGDLSSYFAAKKSNRCDKCGSKGVLACTFCTKGTRACAGCSGQGQGRLACQACYGTKSAPCHGCWEGSGLAWEVTGERLANAGDFSGARTHFERALERTKQANGARLANFEGSDKRRRSLKRELTKPEKALQRKLAATKKKAK